jgi:hypothetical protein
MSLFIDVIDILSNKLKASIIEVIENEQKYQDRYIRKICEICIKYLDFGELRYDKMENGINKLQDIGLAGNSLNILLFAVLNESLDEDSIAIRHFGEFS